MSREQGRDILHRVAASFGLTGEHLLSSGHHPVVIVAREIAIYLMSAKYRMSDPEIGDVMGRSRSNISKILTKFDSLPMYLMHFQHLVAYVNKRLEKQS